MGLTITKRFEGLSLVAYPDPASGGAPWTIGYGHTKGVKAGDTCTEEQAAAWLEEDSAWARAAVSRNVLVPLNKNQRDALVDLVFNIGEGNFAQSTLLKKLNRKDYAGAALEFLRWDKASGKVMKGLTRRRADEKLLFETRP